MKRHFLTVCVASLALAVSACGTLVENSPGSIFVNGIVGAVKADDAPVVAVAAPVIDRAFIEAQAVDLLQASVIARNSVAILANVGTNGAKTTWHSPDQIGVVLEGGLLIGTRGLGHDLMGADVSGAAQSLRGGGTHTRTMEFLDGIDQIQRYQYQCQTVQIRTETITFFERSYATSVLQETCSGDVDEFQNTYWRDGAGVIWQARQWISPEAGYLGYRRL